MTAPVQPRSAPVWIGIDLGTSGVKVVAARADGTIAAEEEQPLEVHRPTPGQVEGDAPEWEAAVRRCLSAVFAAREVGEVAGVGLAGQMHGTVAVGEDGRLLTPPVLWPDQRAEDQAARWASLPDRVLAGLGSPFSAGMTGPVAAWLAEHRPALWTRCARVLLPKDWLRSRLTGADPAAASTDRSDASATLLFDGAAGQWSRPTLAAASVEPSVLPSVVASTAPAGEWRGAPVVAGGGDTPVSLIALERVVDGWRPGDLVVNLGTGAQVISPLAGPPQGDGPPDWHVYADCHEGHYAMVAVVNAGIALSWVRRTLDMPWTEYAALARHAPMGAGGVTFAPFLGAERGAMRPRDRSSDPGWSDSGAGRDRLARAAAEAQAFLVRHAYERLGVAAGRVLLVGGGAREVWVQQLLSDVLALPVHRIELRSAAAMGAAALAAGSSWRIPATITRVDPQDADAAATAYDAWADAYYR